MEIKYSIQYLLIYMTMAGYAFALVVCLLKKTKPAQIVFAIGFAISLISLIYRWINVGHFPLQNLFELFLAMGAIVYLISLFCRKYLSIDQTCWDLLIVILVLFPAGFVFGASPKQLPPALQSVFFVPHVAAYIFAYIFMFKAAIAAGQVFFAKDSGRLSLDTNTYQLICCGFPLLTLGLILGSVWAQYAWGRFWGWDPKEMWSLATWLVYIGYFHFRYMYKDKFLRLNSIWAILGFAAVVITLLWVNLSRIFSGIHSYAN